MGTISVALRVVLLPVLASVFFVAYTYSLPFAQSLLPSVGVLSVPAFLVIACVQGIFLAVVWGIVFAPFFAWLYGRIAYVAGSLCVLPLMILLISRHADVPGRYATSGVVLIFVLALGTIVPGAAQLAYRAFKRVEIGTRAGA